MADIYVCSQEQLSGLSIDIGNADVIKRLLRMALVKLKAVVFTCIVMISMTCL